MLIRNKQGLILDLTQETINLAICRKCRAKCSSFWSKGRPWQFQYYGNTYYLKKEYALAITPFLTKSLVITGLMFHAPPVRVKSDLTPA
jgi:hypothetical protein